MKAIRVSLRALFLSPILVLLHLHPAFGDADFSQVPFCQGKATVTQLRPEDRLQISQMNHGSDVVRSLNEILGDQIWMSQENITDALYKNLGDLSIDASLFSNEKGSLSLELNPRRRIYFYNPPLEKIFDNGKSVFSVNSDSISRYIIVNNLTSKLSTSLLLANDIGGVNGVSLNVAAEVGVSINYVENAKTRRQLPVSSEQSPINLSDEEKEHINAKNLHALGFFDQLGKVAVDIFNTLERKISNIAKKIGDEDSTDVFFDKSFDAFRLPVKLPFNERTVTDKMKVDDLLTISIFSAGGPEIDFGKGILSSSLSRFYRLGYFVTLRKLEGNRVLVRPKLEVKRGWSVSPLEARIRLSLGIASISYLPFLWRMEDANSYSLETVLEFDLNNPEGVEAFRNVLSFSFAKTKNLIMNGSPAAKVSERIFELDKEISNRMRLNIGIAKYERERVREVRKKTEYNTVSGIPSFSWEAETRATNYTLFRGFHGVHEVSRGSTSIIRSNLDRLGLVLDKNKPTEAEKNLSRINMFTFYDRTASATDLQRLLTYARFAIGQNEVLPDTVVNQLTSYYSTHNKAPQSLILITKFDEATMKAILKISPDDFWKLLSRIFLRDPNQALAAIGERGINLNSKKDRDLFAPNFSNLRWTTCRTTPLFSNGQDNSSLSCQWVYIMANRLGKGFEKVQKAESDEERLRELGRLETWVGISPLINNIFIEVYKAVYGSLPKIDYYVRFDSAPGITPYFYTTDVNLTRGLFKRNTVVGNLDAITQSDSRFKAGRLFFSKAEGKATSKLFLEMEAPLWIKPDQRLALWLTKFKIALADDAKATAVVTNLIPQIVQSDSEETLFKYEMELPNEFKTIVMDNQTYEIQVRLENSKGEPLSEFARFKVKLHENSEL